MSIDVNAAPTGFAITDDDLLMIATDIWAAYLGEEQPLMPGDPANAVGPGWHAAISVHGGLNGLIVLEIDAAGATEVTRTMLAFGDEDPIETGDIIDAIGEMVNVLGGNIKSIDPDPSTLGLPLVVSGDVCEFAAPDATLNSVQNLTWGTAAIRISVWSGAAPAPTPSSGKDSLS